MFKNRLQTDFGDIFYTKPQQKTTPDSLVASDYSENLEIGPKSTRKSSWVGGRGEAYYKKTLFFKKKAARRATVTKLTCADLQTNKIHQMCISHV